MTSFRRMRRRYTIQGASRSGELCRRQRDGHLAAARLVRDDELAVVACPKLLVGVEELDAGDRAVRREIDVDLIADPDGLHLRRVRAKADVGHIATRIIGQAHGYLKSTLRSR